MRIVGIDCGSERTGYGVLEAEGRHSRLICVGVIHAPPKYPFPERLRMIYRGLREIFELHSPQEVAVEDMFHGVNSKSALKLAQARGVALLCAAEAELEVAEYSPLEVKSSVVGYGRASKDQVQTMVCSLLSLTEAPKPHDATDALAVALCHAANLSSRAAYARKAAVL